MNYNATCPKYLQAFSKVWEENPHTANLSWFHQAKWGLFIHYGLYSQLKRGEWVLYNEKIPLSEYEKLFHTFQPIRFDADFITDLALEAEMRYINLTSCHHEGFCLWDSRIEPFNSYQACKRDLVRELAEQCAKKGLGFFLYYTHVLNWRHPLAMTGPELELCRPLYPYREPRYQISNPADNYRYWEYVHQILDELLSMDYPITGIWLDLILPFYLAPESIPIEKTYALIRQKRPEILISYKQGATGTEDFAAPEHHHQSMAQRLLQMGKEQAAQLAHTIWQRNLAKHNEYCTTLQEKGWGYHEDSPHFHCEEVWGFLAYALAHHANLLLNIGPLPDGSVHPEDIQTLKVIGNRIRRYGWPSPEESIPPGKKKQITSSQVSSQQSSDLPGA